jgi:hypothetical protein
VASSSTDYGLVVNGFPVFFMEYGSASSMAQAVMELFNEQVGIEDEDVAKVPQAYALAQNYPNPFNPLTTITFEIPESEIDDADGKKVLTRLSIFDMRGRLVRILLEEEFEAGRYQITWDGKNGEGREVSSGIYFYRITSGSFSSTRKMTLMK